MPWNAEAERLIALTAPLDLQDRLRQLPRKALTTTTTPSAPTLQAHGDAIETARQTRAEQDTWPKLHYLWPQRPSSNGWATACSPAGRHRAPLLRSHKPAPANRPSFS